MTRTGKLAILVLAAFTFLLGVGLFVWGNSHNWPVVLAVSGKDPSHSVTLSWTASTSNIVGYHVYVANKSGGPYQLATKRIIGQTTYTDTNVVSGKTYYYIVKSVDSSGTESDASKEVTAKIP